MSDRSQRADIVAELMHPILGCGPDHEIAADYGVEPEFVARIRKDLRRDIRLSEIISRARYLASITTWSDSVGALIVHVLDVTIARAERRNEAVARAEAHAAAQGRFEGLDPFAAAFDHARPQRARGGAQSVAYGRSAGRGMSRSLAPAEASEGISGAKGPEMTATARRRGGPSVRAVRVTGSGDDARGNRSGLTSGS